MSKNLNPSVAVLLPCYNEEVTIGKVVHDFKSALPNADIYVYDNNSTDRTAEIAASEGAIVRKEPRQGKGNVIRAMFEDIDADVYIMSDGDDLPRRRRTRYGGQNPRRLRHGDRRSSEFHVLPREQAPVPQLRQPSGSRLDQWPIPCQCHRHHDRLPCLLVHLRQDLPRAVARFRGRDRNDHPLTEQQPASVRNANPVSRSPGRLRQQA